MKIAVQMFGHLRTFEQCALQLKKFILDHYDCDVFIHTWSTLDHASTTWHNAIDENYKVQAVDKEIIDKMHKLYAPKLFVIESQDWLKEEGYFGTYVDVKVSLKGAKCMVYSQHKVNELRLTYQKDRQVKYDYVVVIRPDIMLLQPLVIDNFKQEFAFDRNTSIHFVFNAVTDIREYKFYTFAALDVFFLAPPEVINKIAQLYLHFDKFFKELPNKTFPKQIEGPEMAVQEYILRQGIVPRLYKYHFIIKRKNDIDDLKSLDNIEELLDVKALISINASWQQKLKFLFKMQINSLMQVYRKIMPRLIKKFVYKVLAYSIRLLDFILKRSI